MEDRTQGVAPLVAEVPMVEPEVVQQMRTLAARGWGKKRIARTLGVSPNTVKHYLRGGPIAEEQIRPASRRLDDLRRNLAVRLFDGAAEGNAVVVHDLLAGEGVEASVRTVQRAVEEHRRQRRVADLATVRYETAPGHQMQVDFGQRLVRIGGELVRVYLLVAVLSFSRRLFVKAFDAERQDDWLEGIAEAFRHFGGVPATVLGDNAKALVVDRDRATGAVRFHPRYLAFCRDWDVQPRACAPYRARTKGKTEAGVKYVKRNAIAGREFDSFAAFVAHLAAWSAAADEREHGTTHEAPRARFERAEARALRPLPARPLPVRQRRLRRRVAADAMVNVGTIRYSVPHRLVRDHVEVLVGDTDVRIFHGKELCAVHRRSLEPRATVTDPAHYEGLWRKPAAPEEPAPGPRPSPLAQLGRTLEDYAAAVGGDR